MALIRYAPRIRTLALNARREEFENGALDILTEADELLVSLPLDPTAGSVSGDIWTLGFVDEGEEGTPAVGTGIAAKAILIDKDGLPGTDPLVVGTNAADPNVAVLFDSLEITAGSGVAIGSAQILGTGAGESQGPTTPTRLDAPYNVASPVIGPVPDPGSTYVGEGGSWLLLYEAGGAVASRLEWVLNGTPQGSSLEVAREHIGQRLMLRETVTDAEGRTASADSEAITVSITLPPLTFTVGVLPRNSASRTIITTATGRIEGDELTLLDEVEGGPTLSGSNLVLGATPMAAGNYLARIRHNMPGATNDGVIYEVPFRLTEIAPVARAVLPPLRLTQGVPMVPLNVAEYVDGVDVTFALAPASGSLVPALSLSPGGPITGTPNAAAAERQIVIRASNAVGFVDLATSLVVEAPPAQQALVPRTAKVVVLGDGTASQGSTLTGSVLELRNVGALFAAASLSGNFDVSVFPSPSATRGHQGANMGLGSDTGVGIASRLPDALAYDPDVLVITGGANDGLTAAGPSNATRAARYTTMAQQARTAGVTWVILLSLQPVAGAIHNAGRHAASVEFNAALRSFAQANPSWCKFVDLYTPHIQASGEAIAGYVAADGFTLTEQGGALNAVILDAVLDDIVAAGSNSLRQDHSTGSLTPGGGTFGGAGGTHVGGGTGDLPTGWTGTLAGGAGVATALEANPETGGQTLVLTFTRGAGTGLDTFTLTPTADLGLAAGSWYMGWFDAEAGGPAEAGVAMSHPCTMEGVNLVRSQLARSLLDRQYLRTPPFKATGPSKPSLVFSIPRGTGSYVVRVRRAMVVPHVSPYTTWGPFTAPGNTTAPTVTGERGLGRTQTINPGAWLRLQAGNGQGRRFRAAVFRGATFVANVDWETGNGSYAEVAADDGQPLHFDVSAANQAEARSAAIRVTVAAPAPDPEVVLDQYDLVTYRLDVGANGTSQLIEDTTNDLDLVRGATSGAESSDPTWTQQGLNFPGTGYAVAPVAASAALFDNITNFTAVIVFKLNALPAAGQYMMLMTRDPGGPLAHFQINVGPGGILSVVDRRPDPDRWFDAPTPIVANRWYTVAGRIAGTQITMWLDGAEIGTATTNGQPLAQQSRLALGCVGSASFSSRLNGEIAYARAYRDLPREYVAAAIDSARDIALAPPKSIVFGAPPPVVVPPPAQVVTPDGYTPLGSYNIDKDGTASFENTAHQIYLPTWNQGPSSVGDPSLLAYNADGSVTISARDDLVGNVDNRTWRSGSMQHVRPKLALGRAGAQVRVTDPSAVAAFFAFGSNEVPVEIDFELTKQGGVIAWSPAVHMPTGVPRERVSSTGRTLARAPLFNGVQVLEYNKLSDRVEFYYTNGNGSPVLFETVRPSDMAPGGLWDTTTGMEHFLVIEKHASWAGWTEADYDSGAQMIAYSLKVAPQSSTVDVAPANTIAPVLTGDTAEGSTLSLSTGAWTGSPAPTYAREYYRNGVLIPGQTGPTYVTQAADVGATITGRVIASNVAGTSQPVTSNGITVTARAPVLTPPPMPGRVSEIRTKTGGRPIRIPQQFLDIAYAESVDPATHPHFPTYTHHAIADGSWMSPATWLGGAIPGENAVVDVGRYDVTYDRPRPAAGQLPPKLWGIHVGGQGELRFSKNVDTLLWVYSIVVHGTLYIGDESGPIPNSSTGGRARVEIVWWFPEQPGVTVKGGLTTMGPVRIYGAYREEELFATANINVGSRTIQFTPAALQASGWRIGDDLVRLATSDAGFATSDPTYRGPTQVYAGFEGSSGVRTQVWGFRRSHDEPCKITDMNLSTGLVTVDRPAAFAHVALGGNLPDGRPVNEPVRVVNLSRSIEFRSADETDRHIWDGADLLDLQKRGHIMFMHSDDVWVGYARHRNGGRTSNDPSLVRPGGQLVTGILGGPSITNPLNVSGRYSWHHHMRKGGTWAFRQSVFLGLVADGQSGPDLTAIPIPGWVYTHHSGRLAIEHCIAYNFRGAGFVSEVCDEIGQWIGIKSIWGRGDGFAIAWGSRAEYWEKHNGHSGEATNNQARQMLIQDSWFTSCQLGHVYLSGQAFERGDAPDHNSLRYRDPITWGGGHVDGSSSDVYNNEQVQIPDFFRNGGVGFRRAVYIAHRSWNDRGDMAPGIFRACHFFHGDEAFSNPQYSAYYSFYDNFYRYVKNGFVFPNVGWGMIVVNCRVQDAEVGIRDAGVGMNYNGFFVAQGGRAGMFVNVGQHFMQGAERIAGLEDPTQHPSWDLMGPWQITNPNDPNPGFTAITRVWDVLDPDNLPLPNSGNYPRVVRTEPNPGRARPYFGMRADGNDLSMGPHHGSILIRGTLVDNIGLRRFGDFMSQESFNATKAPLPDPSRFDSRGSGMNRLERNGAWLDTSVTPNVWKTSLWFVDHDRKDGEYFTFRADATLGGFPAEALQAERVSGPEATRPDAPFLPEAIHLTPPPVIHDTRAPALLGPSEIECLEGRPLAHLLRSSTHPHVSYELSGADAGALRVVNGVISFAAGNAPSRATKATYSFNVVATSPRGVVSTIPRTVVVRAAAGVVSDVNDTFDRADENLEARYQRVDGAAGAAAIRSNRLSVLTTGSTHYVMGNLGLLRQKVFARVTAQSNSMVFLRYESPGNLIGISRTDAHNGGMGIFSVVNGTFTLIGTFPGGDMDVEVDLDEIRVFQTTSSGKRIQQVPITGSNRLPANAPSGTRVGVWARGAVTGWLNSVVFDTL